MIGRLVSPFRDRHFWGGFGAFASRGIVLSASAEAFDPTAYDLAAWYRSDAPDADIEPGFDADFIASVPNVGSISADWEQSTPNLRPLRERSKKAGFFREGRRLSFGTAADATALHDGTSDVDLYFTFLLPALSGTQTIARSLTTFNASGVLLQVTSGGNITYDVGNSGGTSALALASGNGAVSAGAQCWGAVIKRGANVELWIQGALVDSGTIGSPSAGAPNSALFLGATNIGNNPLTGWFPELLIFSGANLPQRQAGESYLVKKHKLSTLTIPSPVQLYTTLDASEVVYESGTEDDIKRVQTVPNHGAAGGTMTQGTASNRPFAVDFMAGRVLYFPGGGERLASSLAASTWAWLHNGTGKGKIGFAFRLESFTGTFNRICGTRDSTAANIGFAAMVRNDGRIRVDITNGSDVSTIQSTTGLVEVGETYRVAIEIDEDDVTIFLDGTQVATGTITSPSSSNPQSTLTLGSRPDGAEPFHGFLSELYVSQDDGSGPMLSNEEIDALLQRHSFDDTIDEAIAMHVAAGDLAAAYTPESIQLVEGSLTRQDVSGNGNHQTSVTDGTGSVTVSALDGLTAVLIDGGDSFAGMDGPISISASFTAVQYAQLTSGILWNLYEGSAPFGYHEWRAASGDHVITRYDGTATDASTAIAAVDTQRFFAHVFGGANDPFNLMQVDDTANSPALNTDPITFAGYEVSAGSGDQMLIAYDLVFDRRLNPGELAKLRLALLKAAAS